MPRSCRSTLTGTDTTRPYGRRMTPNGSTDFDFFFGDWAVHHHRLADVTDRDCTEWVDFDSVGGPGRSSAASATSTPCSGTMPDGRSLEGMTLRLYDPGADLWRIWWSSTANPGRLDPPVEGRFRDGRGVFLGEDEIGGKPALVRFLWSAMTPTSARWEQEFSFDGGTTWDPVLDTRVPDLHPHRLSRPAWQDRRVPGLHSHRLSRLSWQDRRVHGLHPHRLSRARLAGSTGGDPPDRRRAAGVRARCHRRRRALHAHPGQCRPGAGRRRIRRRPPRGRPHHLHRRLGGSHRGRRSTPGRLAGGRPDAARGPGGAASTGTRTCAPRPAPAAPWRTCCTPSRTACSTVTPSTPHARSAWSRTVSTCRGSASSPPRSSRLPGRALLDVPADRGRDAAAVALRAGRPGRRPARLPRRPRPGRPAAPRTRGWSPPCAAPSDCCATHRRVARTRARAARLGKERCRATDGRDPRRPTCTRQRTGRWSCSCRSISPGTTCPRS